jgi:hypothetical protein
MNETQVPELNETTMAVADQLERDIEPCPWCSGSGRYQRSSREQVPCTYCAATGAAEEWRGPAADDWRRRRAAR